MTSEEEIYRLFFAPGSRFEKWNILQEIESVGNRQVMFIDDNFIGTPHRARELRHAFLQVGQRKLSHRGPPVAAFDDGGACSLPRA